VASLGLSCLWGAPTPAVAFPYPEYSPYRATVIAPPQQPQPPRKRAARTAEPGKARPEAPKPPAGPLILAVSIGSQHVTVYDNGAPIASAPISSGMPGRPTPMGVFSVIQKDRMHHSNLYSNAPMPFMQRITWSGVALHAGVLPGYPASHGCIRLPESFAIRLWGMTRMGARVVVTRNDVAPYDINHPRLTALVTKPDPVPEARTVDANPARPNGSDIAAGAVVVASTGPAANTATDGVMMENTPAGNGPPATVERVAATDKPAELRPAINTFGSETQIPVPHAKPADATLRSGALAMFVSRKEGKLYVRKGFEPVFDVPVTIAHREIPFGTHVFTAGRPTDGSAGVRWLAVSIGPDRAAAAQEPERHVKGKQREEKPAPMSSESLRKSAADALDRIELPPEVIDRIMPLVTPGASLLISDQGLGEETGKETDFIVVTK
jgi:hypothetical protein